MSNKPSIRKASEKVGEALLIVVNGYARPYRTKKADEMSSEDYEKAGKTFNNSAVKLTEFLIIWRDSFKEGKDALPEKIDIKLVKEDSLDMNLFKKIIHRSSQGEDILGALERINVYAKDFLMKCKLQKNQWRGFMEDDFQRLIVNPVINSLERDLTTIRSQIERCNLYFQNKLSKRVFWLSVVSIVISPISLVVALLPHLLPFLLN